MNVCRAWCDLPPCPQDSETLVIQLQIAVDLAGQSQPKHNRLTDSKKNQQVAQPDPALGLKIRQ